jgi:hypothetical protein
MLGIAMPQQSDAVFVVGRKLEPPTRRSVTVRRTSATLAGARDLSAARVARDGAAESCERCAKTGRTCPSCTQRRRHVWSLVMERGVAIETVAGLVGFRPERVQQLVSAESDRRELTSLRYDSIPVQRTKAVISRALERDPDLKIADVARWLEMPQADFERAFLGTARAGRVKRRVTVTNASRLMIALGRAPNELEGC